MSVQSIENKALRIFEINRQIALMEEEKARLKQAIAMEMKDNHLYEHVFRLDENSDLKIVVGSRTTKKLDKEELASDLGISLDAAGKKDVLIKKTEEGKLTHAQFKQYEFEETNETVAIRKVNA
ncbi:hypothetical protein [Pseudobacillus badius]|uniref:hypothetical protein n=1 Tax=Bacillus badius TaxID=1455 RepID=UPI0007B39B75|nr:hypothetical protein [Bacillus badius]KZR57909.1 hypothetical protein A3781_19220 [Bacillus badius]